MSTKTFVFLIAYLGCLPPTKYVKKYHDSNKQVFAEAFQQRSKDVGLTINSQKLIQ